MYVSVVVCPLMSLRLIQGVPWPKTAGIGSSAPPGPHKGISIRNIGLYPAFSHFLQSWLRCWICNKHQSCTLWKWTTKKQIIQDQNNQCHSEVNITLHTMEENVSRAKAGFMVTVPFDKGRICHYKYPSINFMLTSNWYWHPAPTQQSLVALVDTQIYALRKCLTEVLDAEAWCFFSVDDVCKLLFFT